MYDTLIMWSLRFIQHFVFCLSVDCNFDSSLCSWKNIGGDQFDWTRKIQHTPTQLTGPSKDHSGTGKLILFWNRFLQSLFTVISLLYQLRKMLWNIKHFF